MGLGSNFNPVFGKFVQNLVANAVKFEEIRPQTNFISDKLDLCTPIPGVFAGDRPLAPVGQERDAVALEEAVGVAGRQPRHGQAARDDLDPGDGGPAGRGGVGRRRGRLGRVVDVPVGIPVMNGRVIRFDDSSYDTTLLKSQLAP